LVGAVAVLDVPFTFLGMRGDRSCWALLLAGGMAAVVFVAAAAALAASAANRTAGAARGGATVAASPVRALAAALRSESGAGGRLSFRRLAALATAETACGRIIAAGPVPPDDRAVMFLRLDTADAAVMRNGDMLE
jgi:hypothetical protein